MDALPNEEILYKIADFWFVRSALQTVVFNKLFYDGYVCCNEGLCPSNKESLQKQLKGKSEFYLLIERNPDNLQELYNRCLSMPSQKRTMTRAEQQSVVYVLLQMVRGSATESFWLVLLLAFYFEKTRFHQCGNFIVADDVDLIKVDSLDQYVKEEYSCRKVQLTAGKKCPPMRRKISHGQRFDCRTIFLLRQDASDFLQGFTVWQYQRI